ncbi:MAG: UDP-N-acetylglucosamine--N-acetylmuramyl-(pentapeptide) pyrophosphoryl-undecaprenol N-acetylglucosamine transferase, partial [Oligoflexia bacterium]|nr:UDP-N-acetylglucosamine--N-acetylmuramyl-(pentapeptide) pyrophosphoryl-undecaprenol N-acetylglucosamine transferase [Oligoflexia bacterium]
MNKKKVVLMAVGSSGGHIYPAFAVAESLKDLFLKQCPKDNSLEIHFVHSGSQLGRKLLSSSPYTVHKISIGGLAVGQSFVRKIKTLFQLPIAFFKSALLIKKIKADLIFGTGGSLSFPVLMAGFFMGKKTVIWEGNTSLGLANKVLNIFVYSVFTVFPQVKGLSPKKQIWSAYPLRKQIQQKQKLNQAKKTQDKTDQSELNALDVRNSQARGGY